MKRLELPNGRIAYLSKDGNIAIYGPDDSTFICSMSKDDVIFLNLFISEQDETDRSTEQV